MGYQNDITVRRTIVYNSYCNNTINSINYYNCFKYNKDLIGCVCRNPYATDVVSKCNLKIIDMKYNEK